MFQAFLSVAVGPSLFVLSLIVGGIVGGHLAGDTTEDVLAEAKDLNSRSETK